MIIIATDKSLPSEALGKITLKDDPTELLERLHDALEANKEDSTSLGSKAFGIIQDQPKGTLRTISMAFGQKFLPDDSQQRAIEHALGSEVTFIVGPPGTGKTSTLAAIAFAYLQEGRSLLIAAHTNIAIDNAIMKLTDMCRDTGRVEELHEGRIIRYGVPQLREQIQSEYSEIYLPAIIKRRTGTLQNQYEQIQDQIDQLTRQLQLTEANKRQLFEKRQPLLEQINVCKQELHVLEVREQQRLKQIKDYIEALSDQQVSIGQEIKFCQKNIAQQVSQQSQWQTKKAQLQTQENSLQLSLAEAQQANTLTKLFKRFGKQLNSQKLALQLGEIKYQLNQCNVSIGQVEANLSQNWHPRRAQAENKLTLVNASIESAEMQLQQPSSDTLKISQLRASKTAFEQKIEEINASIAILAIKQSEQSMRDRLEKLREQRAAIDKQRADMEKNIVAEAQVVATTLCKAYMNKNICDRRFDVVILDEVSMAPLPAVYLAASRANVAVIAIGDPQQLAPIYTASAAKNWLGRDLFELNNITLKDASNGWRNSVLLDQQSRMHPQISRVASKHIYQSLIKDHERISKSRKEYAQIKPLPEKALVLCDTSDYPSIAFRATGGGSHQNTYHALCSFQLACHVLATLPESTRSLHTGGIRVGIVTPYRSQAYLLQGMIKDAGLHDRIRVGTVHRFQGLEAEAIIFDTVESDPLRPDPPFHLTSGGLGTTAMRLVNVAITRAQQKLIIVANQKYIKTHFRTDDTLYLAVQAAAQSGVIQSADVLKETIPPLPNSICPVQLDDRSFYNYFLQDLKEAKEQVIICSPFLGWTRMKEILPELKNQTKRGLQIHVIYSAKRASDSDKAKEASISLVRILQDAHVTVHYRTEMHEKFVFIDKDIMYYGSLNVLSHAGTTEHMSRCQSPSMVSEHKKHWQIETILARPEKEGPMIEVPVKELPRKGGICPNCHQELHCKTRTQGYFGVFYGCPNFPSCRYTDDVSKIHLEKVSRLTSIPCKQCQGPTHIKSARKDAWIACAATPSCGYGQPIKITP
ncbi:MAG: AAA domain-containing protein [Ktedonobacteraceae bacterium]